MTIYYCSTGYHVLCAVLHRLIENPPPPCILFLANTREQAGTFLERIQESGIFNRVSLFDQRSIHAIANASDLLARSTRIAVSIMREEVEKAVPFALKDEYNYYIMCDYHAFAVCLVDKKIQYHYFEDASGVYSRPELLMRAIKSPLTRRLMKDLQLNGRNSFVIDRYLDLRQQTRDFSDPDAIDFRVPERMRLLTATQRQKVLHLFESERILHGGTSGCIASDPALCGEKPDRPYGAGKMVCGAGRLFLRRGGFGDKAPPGGLPSPLQDHFSGGTDPERTDALGNDPGVYGRNV